MAWLNGGRVPGVGAGKTGEVVSALLGVLKKQPGRAH